MTLRPMLTALLGLTLWVQGMAVAAVPVEMPAEPDAAMEMPCHGDGDSAPCDCCGGDCPNMASCVIGHFFAAPPHTPVPATALAHAATATGGWSLKTAVLSLPVRPPIPSCA